MATNWCKHTGDTVLLVEGLNDCHVTYALCKAYQVPECFGIFECGNDVEALKLMNSLIASSTPPKIIGLVIDADNPDFTSRWSSIQRKLAPYNYSLPQSPHPDGTIVDGGGDLPRIGFWLMPDNRVDGMLEDFCNNMIDPNAIATVEKCLKIAETDGHTSFKPTHRSKAVVHTYLAWQDEPGRPLGQAITAQTLRSNSPTTMTFVNWLKDLFDV